MTPGTLNLPTIYRDTTCDPVVITVKHSDLTLFDFTGYSALALIRHLPTETIIFDLAPIISNPSGGEITIPKILDVVTFTIPAGSYRWDLVLVTSTGERTGPWLAGTVVVQDNITHS